MTVEQDGVIDDIQTLIDDAEDVASRCEEIARRLPAQEYLVIASTLRDARDLLRGARTQAVDAGGVPSHKK